MAEQVERAFQKQPTVFLNRKAGLPKGNPKRVLRYYKSVGLGFKTPREAIHGTYIDKKCPFTGNVSIRGSHSSRRGCEDEDAAHHCYPAGLPALPFRDVAVGDVVTVGECRPLSKTVRFNVLKVTKAAGSKKQFLKA
ncbi:hypothetical protein MRX96_032472 [Rhipicephalus microplus]